MIIRFSINYETKWGEELYITGSSNELGNNKISEAFKLSRGEGQNWEGEIKFDSAKERSLSYRYFVKTSDGQLYFEAGNERIIAVSTSTRAINAMDQWQGNNADAPFLTAPFNQVFYGKGSTTYTQTHIQNNELIIKVTIPNVRYEDEIKVCGNIPELGNWELSKAVRMVRAAGVKWEANIQLERETEQQIEYKFIRVSRQENENSDIEWEEGENRCIVIPEIKKHNSIIIEHAGSRLSVAHPKFKGCSVPVFSLKSKNSSGIGDFNDIKLLVDWASANNLSIIQLLPINDTSEYMNQRDSYPYNCISVFALHPIYLNLDSMGSLKDKKLAKEIKREAVSLNHLVFLDYEEVLDLKSRFFRAIFEQEKENTFAEPGFYNFKKENKHWLYPYATFCVLRDKNKSAEFGKWGEESVYSKERVFSLSGYAKEYKNEIDYYIFLQYHAHKQMLEVKEYAHAKNVALKGDLPIGVARHGVDAWQFPSLFNFGMQAGAPPDAFSDKGQNWGFPTYNWENMEKDNYSWWRERLKHMSKYFDAYRIDHVLGFFRIWEIPISTAESSKGHFSPSLPYSAKEIYDMTGLEAAKNKALFIEDSDKPNFYHPAIKALNSDQYKKLSEPARKKVEKLHNDFFYHRNEKLWYDNAMKKLQQLIAATNMLPCAEDLGMLSESVGKCLKDLKILSLEVQSMPKMGMDNGTGIGDPQKYPYLSVCTTSTHDIETLRMWLGRRLHQVATPKKTEENSSNKSKLKKVLLLPDATPQECREVINENLNSSSMLVILPLQDWLSTNPKARSKYPESERINNPTNSNNYWRYRMEINLEELI